MPYWARPPSSHNMFKMSTIGRNARWHFLIFFQNSWEFLVQILHTYYTFQSTLDFNFLSNHLQLWRSYAILSATTPLAFQPMVDILSIFEHILSSVFQISQSSLIRQQNWSKVVDLPYHLFLQFICECDSERIIKIGPHLRELWGIKCVPQFF